MRARPGKRDRPVGLGARRAAHTDILAVDDRRAAVSDVESFGATIAVRPS